jgi:cupin fold WbuC family metalloprotein
MDAFIKKTRKSTKYVYTTNDSVVQLNQADIRHLATKAQANTRGICRLLLHKNVDDLLHQMLIVHSRDKYIRPHKNSASAKSWQIIEGELELVIFNDRGDIQEHCTMSPNSIDRNFIVRLSDCYYHTLIPITDQTVLLETILGPYDGTEYAPWAPEEANKSEAIYYFNKLREAVGILSPSSSRD